jgi:hypothetical protein
MAPNAVSAPRGKNVGKKTCLIHKAPSLIASDRPKTGSVLAVILAGTDILVSVSIPARSWFLVLAKILVQMLTEISQIILVT